MTKLKQNKIWLLILIFTVAICTALFATTFATADEQLITDNPTTYTVSGKVVDSNNNGLAGVTASGSFFDFTGKSYITDDATTIGDGTFTINGVLEGSYGAISYFPNDETHSGVHQYIYDPVTSNITMPNAMLPSLTNDISGMVKDANNNGIANVTLEFYNASSVKAPDPDMVIKTKADGSYSYTDAVDDPEKYYEGLSINSDYYVVAITDGCDKPYVSKTKDIKIASTGNVLDFTLDRIVKVKLYDYDQTPNGWAEWYHEVYLNGVLQEGAGYLGDSNYQIPMNSKLEFKDNCRLEISYSVTMPDNEIYNFVEAFTPAFHKAENWLPKEFDENLVGDVWYMWVNKPGEKNPDAKDERHVGYTYNMNDETNSICLDVRFKDKPITPVSDVTQTAQTGDANGPLIIILAVVLALAIIGLISYFVINKVRKNKTKSKHRKH